MKRLTFIKFDVLAFFLFLHFVAATLFLSRLRKRRTASSGARFATLIRFTANFDPASTAALDPSADEAAEAVPKINGYNVKNIVWVMAGTYTANVYRQTNAFFCCFYIKMFI